jgi:hypothetical protein
MAEVSQERQAAWDHIIALLRSMADVLDKDGHKLSDETALSACELIVAFEDAMAFVIGSGGIMVVTDEGVKPYRKVEIKEEC